MQTNIAVRLKAPDPAAVTALVTLRQIAGKICPLRLNRYELWEFSGVGESDDMAISIVEKYEDIVNPNKETYIILRDYPLPGENANLVWVSVLISDKVDSRGESWLDILVRGGYELEKLSHGVLWRLGFPAGTSLSSAEMNAREIAVTTDRKHGLLGNPISQNILVIPDE